MNQAPPMPKKPEIPGKKKRGTWVTLLFALIGGGSCVAALSLLSFGFASLIAFVGLAVFGVIGFHYFVWGWWLSDLIREAEETRESAE